ncbi:hypothetical protein LTS10_010129 [Elasticomyces elasticus]|nr:hypothetical protein LTS10_010129 [Elasticomyces elasticus]
MRLFQQQLDPASGIPITDIYSSENVTGISTGNQFFDWTVQLYGTSLDFSPVYFLWINPGDTYGFSCQYFNITLPVTTTSTTSSTTSMSATSIPSTASTTSTILPVAASSSSPPSPTANTTVLKVGLGVGLGLGIPLALIAGIWVGMKAFRQRRSLPNIDSSHPLTDFKSPQLPPSYQSKAAYPSPSLNETYQPYRPDTYRPMPNFDGPHEVAGNGAKPIEMGQ